jgi:hypothetical protein
MLDWFMAVKSGRYEKKKKKKKKKKTKTRRR